MRTADEWSELAFLLRRLMPVAHLPTARPLGRDYDVVITEAGPAGDELLCLMDALAGGCGPVIAEAGRPVLCWVVPPGTGDWWDSRYGLYLSAPGSIPFPPLCHEDPIGPYWLRPFRADRRVSPEDLAAALDRVQPRRRALSACRAPGLLRCRCGEAAVMWRQLAFPLGQDESGECLCGPAEA